MVLSLIGNPFELVGSINIIRNETWESLSLLVNPHCLINEHAHQAIFVEALEMQRSFLLRVKNKNKCAIRGEYNFSYSTIFCTLFHFLYIVNLH